MATPPSQGGGELPGSGADSGSSPGPAGPGPNNNSDGADDVPVAKGHGNNNNITTEKTNTNNNTGFEISPTTVELIGKTHSHGGDAMGATHRATLFKHLLEVARITPKYTDRSATAEYAANGTCQFKQIVQEAQEGNYATVQAVVDEYDALEHKAYCESEKRGLEARTCDVAPKDLVRVLSSFLPKSMVNEIRKLVNELGQELLECNFTPDRSTSETRSSLALFYKGLCDSNNEFLPKEAFEKNPSLQANRERVSKIVHNPLLNLDREGLKYAESIASKVGRPKAWSGNLDVTYDTPSKTNNSHAHLLQTLRHATAQLKSKNSTPLFTAASTALKLSILHQMGSLVALNTPKSRFLWVQLFAVAGWCAKDGGKNVADLVSTRKNQSKTLLRTDVRELMAHSLELVGITNVAKDDFANTNDIPRGDGSSNFKDAILGMCLAKNKHGFILNCQRDSQTTSQAVLTLTNNQARAITSAEETANRLYSVKTDTNSYVVSTLKQDAKVNGAKGNYTSLASKCQGDFVMDFRTNAFDEKPSQLWSAATPREQIHVAQFIPAAHMAAIAKKHKGSVCATLAAELQTKLQDSELFKAHGCKVCCSLNEHQVSAQASRLPKLQLVNGNITNLVQFYFTVTAEADINELTIQVGDVLNSDKTATAGAGLATRVADRKLIGANTHTVTAMTNDIATAHAAAKQHKARVIPVATSSYNDKQFASLVLVTDSAATPEMLAALKKAIPKPSARDHHVFPVVPQASNYRRFDATLRGPASATARTEDDTAKWAFTPEGPLSVNDAKHNGAVVDVEESAIILIQRPEEYKHVSAEFEASGDIGYFGGIHTLPSETLNGYIAIQHIHLRSKILRDHVLSEAKATGGFCVLTFPGMEETRYCVFPHPMATPGLNELLQATG